MLKNWTRTNRNEILVQKLNKTKILTHPRALLRSASLSSAKKFLIKKTAQGMFLISAHISGEYSLSPRHLLFLFKKHYMKQACFLHSLRNEKVKLFHFIHSLENNKKRPSQMSAGLSKTFPGRFLKSCKKFSFYFLCIFFFFPFALFAQIEITEIMYDPGEDAFGSKADGGREWIEIYNAGSGSVNLDGWKLVDSKGGHPISIIIQGSFIIDTQEYLIIADVDDENDESTFLTDYPNFSGTILNSNFSLVNKEEGDKIILKDSESNERSFVSYVPFVDAKDTGNSFQKISDGSWGVCSPTPGGTTVSTCKLLADGIVSSEVFLGGESLETASTVEGETPPSTTTTTSASAPTTTYKIEPQIFAQIIPPADIPIAGADFFFEAEAFGLKNEPLENAEYQWTFGDGSKATGQKVLHNYQYPSDYLIVLEVISGKYSGSDRLKIKAIPSDIIISEVGTTLENNFIELHNPSTYELNLSWWRLRVDDSYFTIPKNTILLPKSKIRFSSGITMLFPNQDSLVNLLYPNGSIASHYVKEVILSKNEVIPETKKIQIVPVVSVPAQTQVASIQSIKSEEAELPKVVEDLPLLPSTASSSPVSEPKAKKNLFNKWNLSLVGVISLATVGVVFTNKIDK